MPYVLVILIVLTISFILSVAIIFFPPLRILGYPFLVLNGFVLALFGVLLAIFSSITKVKGKLKRYLNMVSVSAISITLSSIVHNLFYALEVTFSNKIFVSKIMGILGAVFFITAIVIAPVIFTIYIVKTSIYLVKNRSTIFQEEGKE